MIINPISENEASENVKNCYKQIKNSLNLPAVPLFFSYLGPFPEYLSYITNQIVNNLKHPQFIDLCSDTNKTLNTIIHSNLYKSEEITEWLERYQNSPAFYHFQNDLRNIFFTNIKLTFIFIALREALKGYAIAAKQLGPSTGYSSQYSASHTDVTEDRFVFDDMFTVLNENQKTFTSNIQNSDIKNHNTDLVKAPDSSIEKDLLPQYMVLCRNEFGRILKKDYFWTMRVGIEKIILNSLSLFPNLIFSPINIVIQLNEKYSNFYELVYLLHEHFPTYSMHRMIFSGFLLE